MPFVANLSTADQIVAFDSWNSFVTVFNGVKSWVWDVYELLNDIVLISAGGVNFTLFNFAICMLIMEVFLVIYLRMRG